MGPLLVVCGVQGRGKEILESSSLKRKVNMIILALRTSQKTVFLLGSAVFKRNINDFF